MRHLASHLALAVCFTITTGSAVEAGPRGHVGRQGRVHKTAKHRSKAAKTAQPRTASEKTGRKRARPSRAREADQRDDEDDLRDRKRDQKRERKREDDRRHRHHDNDDIEIDEDDEDDKIEMDDSGDDDSDTDDNDDDDDSDDSDDNDDDDDDETDRVAFASRESSDEEIDGSLDSDDLVDAPVRKRPRLREWHLAIGPDLWAASVDANVSLGSATISSGVDFMEITRHTSFGAAAVGEARYGRFSITGNLLYGVIDIAGAKEVGPLMVSLDGTATSLLVDGVAGYRVLGKEDSLVWLEARGGIRYQRTAVSGSLDVSGNAVTPPQQVDAGADALGGGRVFVRPPWMSQRFALSAAFDTRLFGSSSNTWSASADASARITSYALLSLGYRTLTQDRAPVSTTMHGPRVAVQFVF